MDDARELEALYHNFLRHFEQIQTNPDQDGPRNILIVYLQQQRDSILSRHLSTPDLLKVFKCEFFSTLVDFMLEFLETHIDVPSTPSLSPNSSPTHSMLDVHIDQDGMATKEEIPHEDDPVSSSAEHYQGQEKGEDLLSTHLVAGPLDAKHQPAS